MKRLGSIVVSLILSAVIVYLGAGTVVTHCLRTGTVSIGIGADKPAKTESDCCKAAAPDCGMTASPCMQTTVLKLQPTVLSQQQCKVEAPIYAALPLPTSNLHLIPLANSLPRATYVALAPHAPPRTYLAFLQVLQI